MIETDLVAGRRAFEERAWATAYAALRRADDAQELDPLDLEQLGLAAFLTGREAESDAARERAHRGHVARGDAEGAARVGFWLALALTMRGESARGAGWFARVQRVLDEAAAEDSVWRGFLLVSVAMGRLFGGDPPSALSILDKALAASVQFADPDLRALARHGHGQAMVASGEVAQGLTELDEVLVSIAVEAMAPQVVGLVYCAVIDTCRASFDVQRGQEWTAALDRWCAVQPELVPYRGQCLVHRSELLALHGSWSDAATEAERACVRLTQPSGQAAAGLAFYQRGEMHRLRGGADDAEVAYRQASQYGHDPQPGLALLRLAQGDLAAASAGIRRALDEAHPLRGKNRLLPAAVEVALAVGDLGTARVAADRLASAAARQQAPMLTAASLQATGAVLLAEKQPREAVPLLRRAWSAWQKLEAPYEAARARVLLGQACRSLGDSDAAGLEFDAARWVFEQLGATADLTRLEALAAAGRRASPAPDGLTLRELQVLTLVATGATNRAIAEQLFLSEKTVARHVANIFAKVGLSSRSAATAYAYRHHLA
ncbi:MAG TPA: LuxR C-terminal-related transcriptional regulator [Frankiaceae bacterium]|nr:LuxR C-terminal-related transcriptional regulator [Frankiaceae bacterium]